LKNAAKRAERYANRRARYEWKKDTGYYEGEKMYWFSDGKKMDKIINHILGWGFIIGFFVFIFWMFG
jgi:hypothetical protein